MITLFPDQEDWIAGLRDSFRRSYSSPLGVLPTGGGKTVCFSYLTSRLVQNGKRVALLCHRDELVDQISSTLSQFDVRHGLVVSGGLYDRRLLAHVMSVMTLVKRLDRIAVPDYVIIDEAHHGAAATWRKIIAHWAALNPALRVIGVTATPQLLSGKGLGFQHGGLFDDMVLGLTTRELIDLGRLSEYRLFAPSVAMDLSSVHVVAGDYNKKELRAAMDKPAIVGDSIAEYRRHCNYAPAVAFTVSVEKAHETAERFKSAGYNAVAIDGETDKTVRRQVVRDFAQTDGTIHVLVSCSLIDEGFDVPGIVCGIDLAPTMSLTRYLQRVGRTLRVAPGKQAAIILDQAGNSQRHGLPDDPRAWSLEGDRAGKKKKDEETVPCRQCAKCYAVSPAWASKCRDCGEPFPSKPRQIEEVAGTLSEVEVARARREAARDQAAAKTLEDLIRLGTARGYKKPDAWANHIHAARVAKGKA
ncbi:MAG: DEAD/DEAH box helicase [Xanthomonadales bacterium]|nr:DEAD/DEAH box helicase [Xanthomonadales bacterium]